MPTIRTDGRLAVARALLVTLAGSLLVPALPAAVRAATIDVSIRDNSFSPQEVRIDPGDTVLWTGFGIRTHDVTSDTGDFASGDMARGSQFQHTFEKEGYYYYHCSFHGRKGQKGMWGVVIVGNPPPPGGEGQEGRPTLEVPGDFRTIQAAVDAAEPGSTIMIGPGEYRGEVSVTTDDLVIRGTDRFRTVLHGRDERATGFVVNGAAKVTIANLTVRNFLESGISFVDSTSYTAVRIDSIKNRRYGIRAARSYDGVIRSSFAWGSGDSAFSVAECMGCGALLDHVHASTNYIGYSGTNASGVTIRGSTWVGNGAGIVPNTAPAGDLAPNRGTFVVDNVVRANNNGSIPPPGDTQPFGVPVGTGIWLLGVESNVVQDNEILDHERYGVLVSATADGYVPVGNSVRDNLVRDAVEHPLAWDGTGSDNCFSGNDFTGETGPPEIESIYACTSRPFDGAPYPPVREDVDRAVAESLARETEEPREPDRPHCQKGRPGCMRH